MVGFLEEKERRGYPCPYHKTVKTTKTLVKGDNGNYWIVHCPVCGTCAKVPA